MMRFLMIGCHMRSTVHGVSFQAATGDEPSQPAFTPPPIPSEIAFLSRHGFGEHLLRSAAAQAEHWGVSADEALLAMELVDADHFYRALAQECGLQFLPEAVIAALTRQGDVPPTHAPRGAAIRELLADPQRQPNLCLTIPTARRALRRGRCAAYVADIAANALPDLRPSLSVRDGINVRQWLFLLVLSGVVGFLSLWEPIVLLLCGGATASIIFLTMIVLRLSAVRERIPTRLPVGVAVLPDAELPRYTIVVPLYRETRVLPQLIAAMCRLDYPRAKLELKLVVEQEDAETLAALRAISLPPFAEIVVAPQGMPRTKPRALNVALLEATGDLIVVYDAEDVPEPAQLRDAARLFAKMPPEVACLQARLVIDNTYDTWLTRLFTIEYAQLFDVLNPALARFRLPIALGGTSNHFRTHLMRKALGWDAWNVTEDADLGFRLSLMGYRVEDLPSATYEEAPRGLRPWLAQRTRWQKGWMQVCITHSRHPVRTLLELGAPAFLTMLAHSFGIVLTALGYPLFVGSTMIALLHGGWLDAFAPHEIIAASIGFVIFAAGLCAMLLPPLVALSRRRLIRLTPWLLLLPVYYVLMSIAAWRAVWEIARKPDQWNKTEHGLARTSRTGAIDITPSGAPGPSDPTIPRPSAAA